MKFIQKRYLKINNYVSLLMSSWRLKKGLITKIEHELRKEFLSKIQDFGTDDFYQSYPPLHIPGKRNSLCRYSIYGLDKKLSKNTEMLDIGGNIGFFSLFLSRFVKSIDIVEFNTDLTEIGGKLKKYEKIKNVSINNTDFKIFKSKKKYDIVMSLAIHKWVGMDFDLYLEKIHSHLKKGGLLLLESHIIYYNQGDKILDNLDKNKYFKILEKGRIDDHDGQIRDFYWLKAK